MPRPVRLTLTHKRRVLEQLATIRAQEHRNRIQRRINNLKLSSKAASSSATRQLSPHDLVRKALGAKAVVDVSSSPIASCYRRESSSATT